MKLSEQWQDIKQSNIHIIRVLEREGRVQNKFSRNDNQKFLNLRTNTKKNPQRYIKVRFLEIVINEKS